MTSFLLYQAGSDSFCGFDNPLCGIDSNGDGLIDGSEWNGVLNSGLQHKGKIVDGNAYWVRVTEEPLNIEPVLEVESEGDIDAFDPALETNTWFEPGIDTDINGNGFLDYGLTKPGAFDDYGNPVVNDQDTISFRVPTGAEHQSLITTTQEIRVRNMGEVGVLLYKIETDVPWLSSSDVQLGQINPQTGYVLPGGSGQTVQLHANIIGLDVGEYAGTLTVRSNGGDKSYILTLTVPPVDGKYEGTIRIDTVSGKPVVLPERLLRLTLDLQRNSVLHAEGSTNLGTDLNLTNSGDENAFQFATTEAITADAPLNPYGKAYSRTITLSGGRFQSVEEDDIRDTVGKQLPLTGTYTEEISGLANTPILLEGSFVLTPDSDWTSFEEPE
ncbi:MAG: hypothetical protein PF795_06015 [Kiritimatiellae bacterium]|nr:hypothetical protein [Kiritimatiellia bacterium]